MLQKLSGVVSGQPSLINFNVLSDTADCGAAGNGICNIIGLEYNVSPANGGRSAIFANVNVTAALSQADEILGLHAQEGSSYAGAYSDMQALSSAVVLHNGATGWGTLANEFDIRAEAGSSVNSKSGLLISLTSGDAVAGSTGDSGISFNNANELSAGSPGWKYGISFGSPTSGWSINTQSGTVIGSSTEVAFGGQGHTGQFIPAETQYGIDFYNINFSIRAGSSLRMPGFSVSGTGVASIGDATLSSGPSGLTISVPNISVTGVSAITSGGTDYYVNDIVLGSGGGQYLVTSVNGTAISSLQMLVPDVYASCPSTINLNGGSGYSGTFKPTCSALGDIFLGSTASLAPSATSGFVHIVTSSGRPTGIPTNAGSAAIVYDTADNLLCVYNGSWKCASLN